MYPDMFGVMIGEAVFPAEDCCIAPGQLFRVRISIASVITSDTVLTTATYSFFLLLFLLIWVCS